MITRRFRSHLMRGLFLATTVCLVPVVAFLVTGCSDNAVEVPQPPDGDSTIPASWEGIWTFEITTVDCADVTETGLLVQVDTLCAGEPFAFVLPLFGDTTIPVPCAGSITDGSMDVECSSRPAIGCPVDLFVDVAGTRSGDVLNATGRFTATPSEACEGQVAAICADLTIVATRTSTDAPGCGGGTEVAIPVALEVR